MAKIGSYFTRKNGDNMPMATEDERVGGTLTLSREPKGPSRSGDKGSTGDKALMDSLIIVGAAWVILFFLMYSLRGSNI